MGCIEDPDANTQVLAFRSLMKFVALEGKLNGDEHAFGIETFSRTVQKLVRETKSDDNTCIRLVY